jgi:ubiquinone/menaquinone biosynthesis C-methylase UbiE
MIKWLKTQLGKQLSRPQGIWGVWVANMMNLTNRPMYEASYDLLELRPQVDLLEIGFGNGAFIAEILHRIQPGSYSGVEISDTMLRQAGKRNRKEIQQGRVQLLKGAAEKLPFQADRFSRVLTVNTLYFWKDPPAGAT